MRVIIAYQYICTLCGFSSLRLCIAALRAIVAGVLTGKIRLANVLLNFSFEEKLSNRYPLARINDAVESMQAFRKVKAVVIMA